VNRAPIQGSRKPNFHYYYYSFAQNKTLCTIKKKKIKIGSLNKFCDNESDDENEGQGFHIVNEEDELELTDNFYALIRNARIVVKLITDKKRYSVEQTSPMTLFLSKP
jgi:hypothetical protein